MERKCPVVRSLLILALTVATHGQAYSISYTLDDAAIAQVTAGGSDTPAPDVGLTEVQQGTFPIRAEEASAANAELASEIMRTAKPENEDYVENDNGDPQQVVAGVLNAPEPIALLILGLAGIVLTRMRLRKK
jgi:hypothetical protein